MGQKGLLNLQFVLQQYFERCSSVEVLGFQQNSTVPCPSMTPTPLKPPVMNPQSRAAKRAPINATSFRQATAS
jgi:hypothetical protein